MSMGVITALMPVAGAALQLAAAGVKKAQETKELNIYIDRASMFHNLFDADEEVSQKALSELYSEIVKVLAAKGITASDWWWNDEKQIGAPCVRIPVATVRELLDAATR